jgi:hypothetical protein
VHDLEVADDRSVIALIRRTSSYFDQRMRYSAPVRAFHLHDELLGPPFTTPQVAAFTAGTCPTATSSTVPRDPDPGGYGAARPVTSSGSGSGSPASSAAS